jgi:dTDP-4-amino-4,6-dideoxygalactose transaminase
MAKLALKGGSKVREKPFAPWPVYDERDKEALLRVLESREWGGYPEPNTEAAKFAESFAKYHGAKHGICAANGTLTLQACLLAMDIKAGDEVIVTPYTWLATALAPVYHNAVPVFADVDPNNYCLDPAKVEEQITDKTRAVIVVHLGCRIADMDGLVDVCKRHDLVLIEDCAHAHGAMWKGQGVGSWGDFGSFSFQSSKSMTSGEGGLVITNDDILAERVHSAVNCGRKEPGYNSFDGWIIGNNWRIGEFQAALLNVAQERIEQQVKQREENQIYLEKLLADIPGVEALPCDERTTVRPTYQFLFRFVPEEWDGIHRDKFVEALEAEGVDADGYFYLPIYANPLFPVNAAQYPALRERFGEVHDPARYAGSCPATEQASYHEAVWIHYSKFAGDKKDVDDIAEAIAKISKNRDELRK